MLLTVITWHLVFPSLSFACLFLCLLCYFGRARAKPDPVHEEFVFRLLWVFLRLKLMLSFVLCQFLLLSFFSPRLMTDSFSVTVSEIQTHTHARTHARTHTLTLWTSWHLLEVSVRSCNGRRLIPTRHWCHNCLTECCCFQSIPWQLSASMCRKYCYSFWTA